MKQSKTFSSGFSVEETIETLRQTISEKDAEIDRLKTVPMKYRRMEFNAKLQRENDDLRQQLEAANAEIERLNASPTIEACRQMIRDKAVIEASELHNQLAASQAREQQLRDALAACIDVEQAGGFIFDIAKQTLALPQDTTALSAMIAKAGDVMLERCESMLRYQGGCNLDLLRAMPGVTLEDLK